MRSYPLQNNFKYNLEKHHFVYVYEVIIKFYLNFITCLYFPVALINWNSNHCHLMELSKSKESFKEKVDSNNNWKDARQKMILEWHRLFLRLCMKNVEFCGKTSSFLSKRCLFIFYIFLFKWKGVKPTSISNKMCKKKGISNSISQNKRDREELKHNPTSKISILKLLKNCHYLH